MKRKILLTIMLILLATSAYAGMWAKQSAEKTADAAITTSSGFWHGIVLITDGTNAVTVTIYDNATAASGTKLWPTTTVTTGASDRIQSFGMDPPINFVNGIYVDVTTSGTVTYMVFFESN